MKNTLIAPRLALVLCGLAIGMIAMLAPVERTASAAPRIEVQAENEYVIVHMRDGRELHGRVVREDSVQLVLRYLDKTVNIETTLTLQKRDILHIERNVDAPDADDAGDEPTDAPADDDDPFSPERIAATPKEHRDRGMSEGDITNTSLPLFYVIPMKGQMGTDIHPDVYARVITEIKANKPDIVIWKLHCSDVDDLLIPQTDRREGGLLLFDEYAQLVRMLHDDLRDVQQVMWVQDAVGISSVMALAWPQMYMAPNARLMGMQIFYMLTAGIQDPEGLAKNREAILGMGNAFLERGGRSLNLGLAMMDPRHMLSASWRGREVIWHLDTSGEYIVNASTRYTATFNAKTAEDFGISSGTAETLDDLALLLGYREYRVVDGAANQIITRYVEDWRRAFESTKRWWGDYQQNRGWAQGADELRYLGRARQYLRNIIAAMNRFPAVEMRWRTDFGMSKFNLITLEEVMNEQLRRLRNRGGGRGGGGGAAPGGGGLGGPR